MPSTSEKLQADQSTTSSLVTMWFLTKSGTKYELPDMQPNHVDAVHRQLAGDFDRVMATNISEALLYLPKPILKSAGVGERCFWENDAD